MAGRLLSRLDSVLWVVGCILLFACGLIIFAEVNTRGLFGGSLGWAEELVRLLFAYSTFLLIGPCLRRGAHIKMTLLQEYLPPRARNIVRLVWAFIILILAVFLAYQSGVYARYMYSLHLRSDTPLGAPPWVGSLGLSIGMLFTIVYAIGELWQRIAELKAREQ